MFKIGILFLLCITTNSYGVAPRPLFSFDSFPLSTWYEKSLNALIASWHKIQVLFVGNKTEQEDSLDIVLGKSIFACFCLEKMICHKQMLLHEDIEYFQSLIYALEVHLKEFSIDSESQDHLACLENIIAVMKNNLQVPSNIQTK